MLVVAPQDHQAPDEMDLSMRFILMTIWVIEQSSKVLLRYGMAGKSVVLPSDVFW